MTRIVGQRTDHMCGKVDQSHLPRRHIVKRLLAKEIAPSSLGTDPCDAGAGLCQLDKSGGYDVSGMLQIAQGCLQCVAKKSAGVWYHPFPRQSPLTTKMPALRAIPFRQLPCQFRRHAERRKLIDDAHSGWVSLEHLMRLRLTQSSPELRESPTIHSSQRRVNTI